ncbi:MAG: hypothetical protein IJL47_06525 [Lachnospiraceae bacterium]|nr:hypothetical protein [Lachnospiraceae bacterium]
MKKLITLVLAIAMILSLSACGGQTTPTEVAIEAKTEATTEAKTEATTEEPVTTTEVEKEPLKLTKEDLLKEAEPLKTDVAEKMFDNPAFSTTQVGKVYTFEGKVYSIGLDYADLEIFADDGKGGSMGYGFESLAFRVYLPVEELVNLKVSISYNFVGKIFSVSETEGVKDPYSGMTMKGSLIEMQEAYLNK